MQLSGLREKFFPSSRSNEADGTASAGTSTPVGEHSSVVADDKNVTTDVAAEQSDEPQKPNEEAQEGVRAAEAITLTWTKTSLGIAYFFMWSLYMVNAMQNSITGSLSAYVTSDFESHSLLPVISVVSSVMGAATYMPLAKILNLFDRSIGFVVMVAFATLGLILSACCTDIETYCAAQVFYTIGFTGMIFAIDVITADTSTLRDRGLAYAFTSSPYIISAFAGPSAAEDFYATNWRWGYGCFAIVLPVVATPMFVILRYNRHLAKKNGLLQPRERSGRTFLQNVWHFLVEFDLIGTFLLAAGLVLMLLPFTIASSAANEWAQGYIIAMLVLGFACLVAFALSERYLARVPFLPWNILVSRTVLGACLLDLTYQIAYYCWDDYYTSYLQVVYGTSIEVAGYISNIFDVVSGVWLLFVGLAIKKTGRFRWLLYFAVPLYLLGVGLMIYFRRPGWSVGYPIMCQIFIAFAGGTMIIVQQVAVLAVGSHNDAASALAVLGVFGNIGGAIGGSISGAIWTNSLPAALKKYLPDGTDWQAIYDSLSEQLSYGQGTPIRHAIQVAYGVAQSRMLIAGTAIMALSLIWMVVIRDIKVTKQQTKGVLF